MLWPDELVWQAAFIAVIAAVIVIAIMVVATPKENRTGELLLSGFTPTAPILPSVFALVVLVMIWGPEPGGSFPHGTMLLSAMVIAVAAWMAFAIWRGRNSSAQGVAPELYESLKTDYLALCNARFPTAERAAEAAKLGATIPFGQPGASDGPLPEDRLDSYVTAIGREMDFVQETIPDEMKISARAWNTGAPYLETQRKMSYVRDSMVAHEANATALHGHALALELRLNGANMGDSKAVLTPILAGAKEKIGAGEDLLAQARSLFLIASTMSAAVYDRQKTLVRIQLQQQWLVVVVQLVTIAVLAIALLAGASDEAISTGGLFYLLGAGSGILSLLHVRQSIAQPGLGEDYGLLRVELARAFTLSGLAAVIAVFLIANLPVIASSAMFDPPTPTAAPTQTMAATEPPATPIATEIPTEVPAATEIATPNQPGPLPVMAGITVQTLSYSQPSVDFVIAQGEPTATAVPTPVPDDVDDQEDWRPLNSVYAFGNLAGILIALLAGWIPERLFRSLTSYGNRLRYDIQSMSKTSG